MATRQYIGARYVPKFFNGEGGSTEWVSGIPYEPLTIVTYLGNSYTSKKPVPIGIDILNSEYWANTGMWNSQVEQYRQEVEEVKNELGTKENIARKILIIGDSYLDRTNSYGDKLASIMGSSNVVLKGESGAGFLHYSTLGNKTFEGILTTYVATLTDDEKASFTDVMCIGGSNDRSQSESPLLTAIASFFTIAKANFTNARFHLGFLGWTGFSSTYQSADKLSFLAAKKVYEKATYANAIKWIENLNYLMHDYSHYADEGHPDTVLSARIGDFLYRYITNGYANAEFETSATFTLNTDNFSLGEFDLNISKISASVKNGVTIFKVNGTKPNFANYGKISLTTTDLPENGGIVQLCTMSGGGVFGIEDNDSCNPILITVPATFTNTNNSLVRSEVTLLVMNGAVSIIFINGLVNSYTNIIHIVLGGFEIVLDTDYA